MKGLVKCFESDFVVVNFGFFAVVIVPYVRILVLTLCHADFTGQVEVLAALSLLFGLNILDFVQTRHCLVIVSRRRALVLVKTIPEHSLVLLRCVSNLIMVGGRFSLLDLVAFMETKTWEFLFARIFGRTDQFELEIRAFYRLVSSTKKSRLAVSRRAEFWGGRYIHGWRRLIVVSLLLAIMNRGELKRLHFNWWIWQKNLLIVNIFCSLRGQAVVCSEHIHLWLFEVIDIVLEGDLQLPVSYLLLLLLINLLQLLLSLHLAGLILLLRNWTLEFAFCLIFVASWLVCVANLLAFFFIDFVSHWEAGACSILNDLKPSFDVGTSVSTECFEAILLASILGMDLSVSRLQILTNRILAASGILLEITTVRRRFLHVHTLEVPPLQLRIMDVFIIGLLDLRWSR